MNFPSASSNIPINNSNRTLINENDFNNPTSSSSSSSSSSSTSPSTNLTKLSISPEDANFLNDTSKPLTRMLLTRSQFSRLIGKGGQNIGTLRSQTGAYIKGIELNKDLRLVILTGSLDAVQHAFEKVCEIFVFYNNNNANNTTPPSNLSSTDNLVLEILLDHSKAGKVIGSKGIMLQQLKDRSNLNTLKIDKEPFEISDLQYRKLTLAGSTSSLKKAHKMLLDIFSDFSAFYIQKYIDHKDVASPPLSDPNTISSTSLISCLDIVKYGLPPETARQLEDMKEYLLLNYNLELLIRDKNISHGRSQNHGINEFDDRMAHSTENIDLILEGRNSIYSNEEYIKIPSTAVGSIIGFKGSKIKEFLDNYFVKVFVEKEDYLGYRIASLSYVGENLGMKESYVKACKMEIEKISSNLTK